MKVVLFALNASWAHTNLAVRCLREPLERAGFAVTVAARHNTMKPSAMHHFFLIMLSLFFRIILKAYRPL